MLLCLGYFVVRDPKTRLPRVIRAKSWLTSTLRCPFFGPALLAGVFQLRFQRDYPVRRGERTGLLGKIHLRGDQALGIAVVE